MVNHSRQRPTRKGCFVFPFSFFRVVSLSRGLLSPTGLAGWSRLTPLCGVLLDRIPAGLPGYSKTVVREKMWAHSQYSLLVVGAAGGRISWDPESALWERLWGDPVPSQERVQPSGQQCNLRSRFCGGCKSQLQHALVFNFIFLWAFACLSNRDNCA